MRVYGSLQQVCTVSREPDSLQRVFGSLRWLLAASRESGGLQTRVSSCPQRLESIYHSPYCIQRVSGSLHSPLQSPKYIWPSPESMWQSPESIKSSRVSSCLNHSTVSLAVSRFHIVTGSLPESLAVWRDSPESLAVSKESLAVYSLWQFPEYV